MTAIEALGRLQSLRRPIIQTREAAARLGVSRSRASQLLSSFEQAGLARRLKRGLWALQPDTDPFTVPPHLTAPLPAYVSFWSALFRHGMIEQVPRLIFVASLARTQRIATPLGAYSIHHLAPELFAGFDGSEELGYLALPEKALFDTVYLRAAAGGAAALPELELPPGFREQKLEEWIDRVARPRLRTLVSRGLDKALAGADRPN
ncbi:MAG: type IV toxin-antitoxin system AbiEi family antitoxin domain-containing protein [Actinomycetes bacterium]